MIKYYLSLAEAANLTEILHFEQTNLPDAWSLASLEAALTSPYQQIWLLRAEAETAVKGLLHWTHSDNYVDILNFALVKEHRQQGLAKELLKGLFAFLTSEEKWQAWQKNSTIKANFLASSLNLQASLKKTIAVNLEVRASNTRAINCYTKLGFVCLRQVKNYYKEAAYQAKTSWDYQGETALCMQKLLN